MLLDLKINENKSLKKFSHRKWTVEHYSVFRLLEKKNNKNHICLKPLKIYIDWIDCYAGDNILDFLQTDKQLALN